VLELADVGRGAAFKYANNANAVGRLPTPGLTRSAAGRSSTD